MLLGASKHCESCYLGGVCAERMVSSPRRLKVQTYDENNNKL
jgi:hypothetical protein